MKKAVSKAAPKKNASKAMHDALTRELSGLMQEIEENPFNPEDLHALFTSLASPGSDDSLPDEEFSAKSEAQNLAFEAMEAGTPARARKLAKRALASDPACVDALVLLARLDSSSPEEAIEGLQQAVAAGERSLGTKFIHENKGHFWMLIETRPYMRALGELANLLRIEQAFLAAIGIYEKMLELNPNDNQGVRDPLLGLYLAVGDLKGASKLLKKYKDDAMANSAWCRVLERWLSADLSGAESALKAARRANRFVELYLTAQKAPPKGLPDMYSAGSEEEAILCVENILVAWTQHKQALLWLINQVIPEPTQPDTTRIVRKKT